MKTALSRCEFEIAERLALGQTKKEVANRTFRSVYTVETTVKNIYEKLGFNKLSDLTLWYCGITFGIAAEIGRKKREIIATCLLSIFLYGELVEHIDFFRRSRSRTEESRTARRNRRADDEAEPFILEILEPYES